MRNEREKVERIELKKRTRAILGTPQRLTVVFLEHDQLKNPLLRYPGHGGMHGIVLGNKQDKAKKLYKGINKTGPKQDAS